MDAITQAFHAHLSADAALAALLAGYRGAPAVFTTDPAPGDAVLPYIVTAGEVAHVPFDTKTTLGHQIMRDVRCYDAADGSAATVEAMADRVWKLLHRQPLIIPGFVWIMAECSGPIVADEQDAYGRIVTAKITIEEV